MENINLTFLEKINQSNEMQIAKIKIQNLSNNVGAILSMLSSLPNLVDDVNYYDMALKDINDWINSYSHDIDKLVYELRTTSENKESEVQG